MRVIGMLHWIVGCLNDVSWIRIGKVIVVVFHDVKRLEKRR